MTKEIFDRVREDYFVARKARGEDGKPLDQAKIDALGMIVADTEAMAKNASKPEDRVVSDVYTVKVLKAAVDTARENIVKYESVGRDAGSIRREMDILKAYLPEEVSADEIRTVAAELAQDDAVKSNPRAGMGIVIAGLKARYGARYDKSWSAIVKEVIGV